jgi:FixJ family two-component response regulator
MSHLYLKLMISQSKIDLREHTRTTELIKQIINPRQRVLVLDSTMP